jgi:hypothetical protein
MCLKRRSASRLQPITIEQQHDDARAERPVQRAEEFVVSGGGHDFQAPAADQRWGGECRCRQRKNDDRARQHARQDLRQHHAPEYAHRRAAERTSGPFHLRIELL